LKDDRIRGEEKKIVGKVCYEDGNLKILQGRMLRVLRGQCYEEPFGTGSSFRKTLLPNFTPKKRMEI
jgi:hypothetical protein